MIDPLLWIWLAQACSPGSDAWGILRDAGHTPLSLRAAGREELTALIDHASVDGAGGEIIPVAFQH